jgi:CHAD domain-containing protein
LVSQYLEPATADLGHESEYIHQLRVATRRCGAAMEAFRPFLPRGKARRLRRALKRIRKAAGTARDIDVMAIRFSAPRDGISADTHDALWARIVDARRAAQPAVDEVYRRCGQGEFVRRGERLLARVRWRGNRDEPTFAELANSQLCRVAADFFAIASERPRRAAKLHAMRIAGKQLRYALELFAAAVTGLRDEIYPVIEQIQQRLGSANDHSVGAQHLAAWGHRRADASKACDAEFHAHVENEKKKAAAARRAFRQWWTTDRCASLKRRFDELMRAAADNPRLN